jgi:hypothetical protein
MPPKINQLKFMNSGRNITDTFANPSDISKSLKLKRETTGSALNSVFKIVKLFATVLLILVI